MGKRVYLDHAATTPVKKAVLEKMLPYFSENFGNANSQHSFGRDAQKAVDNARDGIAAIIGAKPSEIYFTSGGTEADNWALRGAAYAHRGAGKHIIISAIEHHAMLSSAEELAKEGFSVSLAPVSGSGIVDVDKLKSLIREDTIFVGVMLANNEVGTIQPIEEIAKICKEKKILFFSDAVQAMGAMNIDVKALDVDMLSFSAHKFGGPKGMGALYIKTGVKIDRLIVGGFQERTKRGGTTNVPSVVGFYEALRLSRESLASDNERVKALRDRFVSRVEKEIPFVTYNGDREKRLPSNANFSFKYIEGESILFSLDLAGIAVSSGSACSSGSLDPSHVLLAMGVEEGAAHGSIRFSFGAENTNEEVDYVVDNLKEIVDKLRKMSPLYSAKGE